MPLFLTEDELIAYLKSAPSYASPWREHKYVGGPPPPRIRKMQYAHEARARQAGVQWEIIDPRTVYKHHQGLCGICHLPVELEIFTIDHIVPLDKGGPHIFSNLQPAHWICNVRKGNR